MDLALKQRLIGAAVLVALAVIVLPMLMEGPAPEPGVDQVPLEMPAAPKRPVQVQELPLSLPPDSGQPGAAEDADPDRIATVQADAAPRVDALESATPERAPAATTTLPPAPAAPEVPAAQAGGDYVVNLGSYRDAANARGLLEAFKTAGLPAYGESIQLDGQGATRLRLGPYASRAEAESARLAARKVRPQLKPSVVALNAAAPVGEAAPATGSGYVVQVGAFAQAGDAQALSEKLRGAGFVAYSEAVRAEHGTLHRVRVGPEADQAAAERLRERLRSEQRLDGVVLRYP